MRESPPNSYHGGGGEFATGHRRLVTGFPVRDVPLPWTMTLTSGAVPDNPGDWNRLPDHREPVNVENKGKPGKDFRCDKRTRTKPAREASPLVRDATASKTVLAARQLEEVCSRKEKVDSFVGRKTDMVALGDGAFNCKDIIEICNKKGAYFIFSAKSNNYVAYQMMKQKVVSVSSAIQTQVNKEKPDPELYRKQGRAKKKKLGNLEGGVKCFHTKIFLERNCYLKTLKIDLHGVEVRLLVFQKKQHPGGGSVS